MKRDETTPTDALEELWEDLSPEDLAMIDQAWECHKAAIPVATVINDNQPGRTAIIEILSEPPTLPVGTKLYAEPKRIASPAASSQERIAQLERVLREMFCPRPCNGRPDQFDAGDCFDAGECGCGVALALGAAK